MPGSQDAERRRRALQRFINARGINPNEWAKRAGMPNANTIYNFLRKRSASLSVSTLERLAAAESVTVAELTGGPPAPKKLPVRSIHVIGEVQAGVWREAVSIPEEDRFDIQVPAIAYVDGAFGLVVRGDSMDREYPPGTILICVDIYDYGQPLNSGREPDHVIVERVSKEGLVEATCKELVVRGDRAYLWPRSHNPEHQSPIAIPWPYSGSADAATGVEEIRIRAVVIGSYRPRRF